MTGTPTTWTIIPDTGDAWIGYQGDPDAPLDVDGCLWDVLTDTGWRDSPEMRQTGTDRPLGDGVMIGPGYLPSQTIELAGEVWAPDQASLFRAMARMRALLAVSDGRTGTLQVLEDGGGSNLQTSIRRGGATLVAPSDPRRARWSLSLLAIDPHRYGVLEHSATTGVYSAGVGRSYSRHYPRTYGALGTLGRLSLVNEGNDWADVLLTIHGPVTGPTVTLIETQRHLSVELTVPVGGTLELSSADRSVLLDGGVRRANLTADSQWFRLPPGSSTVAFTAVSGAGTLTVTYSDTYT